MKKVILSALILSLVISMCACQDTAKDTTDTTTVITTDTADTTDKETTESTPVDTDHTDDWYWTNGVYFNSFVGMTFKTFDNWSQFTDEELAQMQESDYANLDPVVKNIYKDRIIYAAYSASEDKDSYFSMGYENKTKLENIRESRVTLDSYISDYKNSMTFMYKDVDINDMGEISFCGNTYRCLEAEMHSGEKTMRKNIYFRLIDDYFITITLTAGPNGGENIDDIAARCTAMLLQNNA